MKQLKYILIFGMLIFMPSIVKAEECPVSNTARLKKIASNITTKYDYVENIPASGYGNVQFTLTISNVTSDIYIMNIMNIENYYDKLGTAYYGDNNNQVVINGLSAGTSYRFVAYGNTNDICKGLLVYEFIVTTPSYNKYYTSDLCDKIPDYKYCQKWANINVTEEEFTKKVKEYIKSLETEDLPEEEEPGKDDYQLFIEIVEFLNKYNIPIFGSIILLSLIGIITAIKKDSFDLNVK
jgi:hypothetical protein